MGHFYFVRHGQTVWNVENKICGATDSPLTDALACRPTVLPEGHAKQVDCLIAIWPGAGQGNRSEYPGAGDHCG